MPDDPFDRPSGPDNSALRLLLACSRADLGLAGPGEVGQAVQNVMDWNRVKAIMTRHGLLPLLHQWLGSGMEPHVPAEFRDSMVELFRAHTFRALGLTQEMLRLIRRFEALGIPVLSFKGPVLAQQIYGQVARREFLDLDLLVREADVQGAADLLRREGYRPQYSLSAKQLACYRVVDCELAWFNPDRGVAVDLHWGLAPPPYANAFPESDVWRTAHHVGVSGAKVRTLRPATLVPFLFFHHSKHDWAMLAWLNDLAMLVRGFDAEAWGNLMQEAQGRRMSRMVRLGAHLIQTLFQFPLPEPIARAVRDDPRLPRLLRAVRTGLWCPEIRRRHSPLYRASMDSRADACRFWRNSIFQPRLPDWQMVNLPGPLRFLYVPLRLARLVAKRIPFPGRRSPGQTDW